MGRVFFRILTSGSLTIFPSAFISNFPDSSPGGGGHSSLQIILRLLIQSARRKDRPAVRRNRDIREMASGPKVLGEESILWQRSGAQEMSGEMFGCK